MELFEIVYVFQSLVQWMSVVRRRPERDLVLKLGMRGTVTPVTLRNVMAWLLRQRQPFG